MKNLRLTLFAIRVGGRNWSGNCGSAFLSWNDRATLTQGYFESETAACWLLHEGILIQ